MARGLAPALLMLAACKAELAGDLDDASVLIDANTALGSDAMPDAGLGPWGTPQPVPGASDATLQEDDPTLSSNALELYFKRIDAGDVNLYVMTRATTSGVWSTPAAVTALNTTATEESPRLSSDDLTIYFGRAGDIFKATRATTADPWGAPVAVAALNTTAYEKWAAVCSNGYAIVSRAVASNGQDLFEGTEAGGASTAVSTINGATNEQGSFLTSDCLHMYFQSNRDGDFDLYESTRATASSPWGAPSKLPDFNAPTTGEEDPWISPDQRIFVYASNAGGTKDVLISTR